MRIGVLIFPTDQTPDPVTIARAVEERGFESLWFPEHTHIPTSRETPFPGGIPLPEHYRRTYDPFVAFGAAAAVTTTLKLGTGICLVAQRDPIVLAKEVASVDRISNGRFLFGVGVGWNVDEMRHHGVDPTRRRAIAREKVLAMKGLWSEDASGFQGEHVSFSESWSWPKPLQRGGPPVIMGGAGGPVTFRHVAEWCDGWMPIHGRRDIFDKLPELATAVAAAGRPEGSIELGVFGCPAKPEVIESYQEHGFARVVLGLPQAGEDEVLATLDRYAALLN